MAGLMGGIRRSRQAEEGLRAEMRGEPKRSRQKKRAAPVSQVNRRMRPKISTKPQGLRDLPMTRAQPVRSISGADERSRRLEEIQRRIKELGG